MNTRKVDRQKLIDQAYEWCRLNRVQNDDAEEKRESAMGTLADILGGLDEAV